MAVAVVTMAVQAMAMAPIIGDIPSPVVGDNTGSTSANEFVYPDAIDLTAYVTDKTAEGADNPPANIMWSYEIIGQTAKYRINNRDQLAPADDPANPPAAKRIDGPGSLDDDPAGTNDAASKITIRNINLSPIGGPNVDPGPPGIVAAETQPVTFYAGDGTTFSFKSVLFYTDNDGLDRLSGVGADPTPVYSQTFTGTVGNWGYTKIGGVGNANSSYNATIGAICITTPGPGENLGVWSAPYNTLPLVANAVYKIRAEINSSQATTGQVVFWDLLVNSFGYENPSAAPNSPVKGMNLYGGNYMFLDNTGGANAALSSRNPMEFVMYWCPSPLTTTQWNDPSSPPFPNGPGPFAPAEDANNDGFIEFRVLDSESAPGIHGGASNGTLCLDEVEIVRFDVNDVTFVSTKLDQTTITQGGINNTTSGGGNTRAWALAGANVQFNNNTLTIDPTSGPMLTLVEPGDYTFPADLSIVAQVTDNYPVPMTPQTLYRIEFRLSAPTTADENAPMDLFWVGADTPTNELINLSYVTVNAWHHGMPKAGSPQTYTAFFYSNYGTAASNPAHFSQFRWRMMFGNADTLGGPGEPNTGAITLHSVKVDEVSFE